MLYLCLFLACGLTTHNARAEFTHPGVAHSAGSIAFVKAQIKANQQPWATAWQELSASRYARLDWQPEPIANVERGASNNPDIGSSEFSSDARAAYVHAICWTMTDNVEHAKKSAEILDAWSETLESIGNHDARLLIGMDGYKFTVAAELLKHTWDGWPSDRQERFGKMAREVWYPVIVDFYPSANGNWDASMLQTMMAMGVFLDDQAMFDRAKDYFISGEGNGAIGMYFKASGQCQETGRDQAHTQMGLDYLSATCETAWIQGIDLYSELDNRLLKGFEYTAKYNLGNDVPYEPYRSFEGRYHYKQISDNSRGRLRPMYERVFNHYHNRRGLDAPFTEQAVANLRGGESQRERTNLGDSRNGRDRNDRPRGRRRRDRTDTALDTLMYAQQPATFPEVKQEENASPKPESIQPSRRVTYKSVGETKLDLHVFEPEGHSASDRRAAIVFFFGGGWSGGDPNQFYEHSQALSKLGMVAFSAEYRVKSRNKTTPLECVKDAKSAIRWVREHASELGVDPNRIVASGGSAGGHIAACTGIVQGHEEDGEDTTASSAPNAMILFNPVLDTSKATGFAPDRFTPEQQLALSPCHQIRENLVPTILFHGTADTTVPFEQAERFTRLMKEAANECVLVPFPGKSHGFFNATSFRAKNDNNDYNLTMQHSIDFLKTHGFLTPKRP